MFFSSQGNLDITRRVELGSTVFPPLSTYQLDRGRLENMLGSLLSERGIAFLDGCKVLQVNLQPERDVHSVQILQEDNEREISARWIVDASGRNTLLQRQLGLAKKGNHHANSVWFRVGHPIDINEWASDPAWKARITSG